MIVFSNLFRKFAPMESTEKLALEEKIVKMLKTVYDPEIPVNVYDLGLIYKIDLDDNACLRLDMTLTAPNCPAADFILEDIRMKLESIEGIKSVDVNLVFEPEWNQDMMTEEAKLELFYDGKTPADIFPLRFPSWSALFRLSARQRAARGGVSRLY